MKYIVFTVIYAIATMLWGSDPTWWAKRGVILEGRPSDDYAVLNQGQLKHLARCAHDELNEVLGDLGGAGGEISSLVESWNVNTQAADDFAAVNVGQLKAVAKLFHKRGLELGFINEVIEFTSASDDFSAVNIGQAKALFSFNITAPTNDNLDENPIFLPSVIPRDNSVLVSILQSSGSTGSSNSPPLELSYSTAPQQPEASTSTGLRLIGIEQSGFAHVNTLDVEVVGRKSPGLSVSSVTETTEVSIKYQDNNQFFSSSKGESHTTITTVNASGNAKFTEKYYLDPVVATSKKTNIPGATREEIKEGEGSKEATGKKTDVWVFNGVPDTTVSTNYWNHKFGKTDEGMFREVVKNGWTHYIRPYDASSPDINETREHTDEYTYPQAYISLNTSLTHRPGGSTGLYYPYYKIDYWPVNNRGESIVPNVLPSESSPNNYTLPIHLIKPRRNSRGEVITGKLGTKTWTEMLCSKVGEKTFKRIYTFHSKRADTEAIIDAKSNPPQLRYGTVSASKSGEGRFDSSVRLGSFAVVAPSSLSPCPSKALVRFDIYLGDEFTGLFVGTSYKIVPVSPEDSPSMIDIPSGVGGAYDRTTVVSLVAPLPVELNSRDRAVEGFIPNIDPSQPLKVKFTAGNKTLGPYEIPTSGSSNDVYVYDSEADVFSDSEAETWKNKNLPEKAWNQEVNFVREGNGVRFSTVSDNLGVFRVTLYYGSNEACSFTHQLTEDKEFARLITAVHGMVSGKDPPKIKAWDEDPDPFEGDDNILAAPPATLSDAALGDIIAGAPPLVSAAFTDTSVIRTKDGFNQFVNLVRERTTETEWIAFGQLLTDKGATPTLAALPPGMVPAAADAANGGSWWPSWGSDKPEPRVDMQLPPEISNRGLVAKCLIYWVKKLIVAQVAYGEGLVFGLWDGVVSDVEGVGAVLKAPVDLINKIRDPWGAAAEIYHAFKAIKELGLEGVKQNVIEMFNAFMKAQEDRLEVVLSDQCKDPIYFKAYMGGYLIGYVGEQVVVTMITAGSIKAGWVGKAIRGGSEIISKINSLTSPLHQFSKAFGKVRSRYTRTADELRAMRAAAQKCGPEGFCLVAGTLVLMGDHTFKKVDDIIPGDLVWADDPDDDKPAGPTRVQFQTANFTLDPIRIDWDRDDDGKPDGSVTASPVHPFYVVGDGWVDADHLEVGQQMFDEQGRTTTITSLGIVPGRAATYDIGLEIVHGFFAGATPQSFTLTHNANHDVNPYWKQADPIPGMGIDPVTGKQFVYRKHHFFYDAWLAVHYDGLYRKGRLDQSFPTIHVTPADHNTMHGVANQYFLGRFGVTDRDMGPFWKDVSVEDMEKLALSMGNAAGIPKTKMEELMNKQNQWFFKKMKKIFGCIRQ